MPAAQSANKIEIDVIDQTPNKEFSQKKIQEIGNLLVKQFPYTI